MTRFFSLKTQQAMLLTLSLALFAACDKKNDQPTPVNPTPKPDPEKKQWVAVYRDVTLGDQENHSYGHFLKTSTGETVPVEQTVGKENQLAMMFFTEYSAAYSVLTFPGDAHSAASYDVSGNRLFTQNPGGIDSWSHASYNTGEIGSPVRNSVYMTPAEFNALASNATWHRFDSLFRYYNDGDADLSFEMNYKLVENGNLYKIQLNNSVRALIYVKNVVPSSASGGSIRFDMVIEGSEAMTPVPESDRVQPASGKD